MKLVKSLLLGSAAGIVAVGSAVAADLPVRKAAPVDYVQVCSQFGTGYFFIPGTDTCLRISGYVRYQAEYNQSRYPTPSSTGFTLGTLTADAELANVIEEPDVLNATSSDPTVTPFTAERGRVFNQFARAALNFDARTATEFGTLRSYASMFVDSDGVSLNQAYIEFAGLTAGQAPSFFRTVGVPAFRGSAFRTGENNSPMIGYTLDMGAFSAFISAEDRGINTTTAGATVFNGGAAIGAAAHKPSGMPDIVGGFQYSEGGIRVRVSGALNEIRTNLRVPAGVNPNGAFVDSKFGYAIQAGAVIDLPMIGSSTNFQIQGTYAEGAINYVGVGQAGNRFTLQTADAYRDASGSLKMSRAWGIYGTLNHGWAPNFTQSLYGSYGEYDAPSAVRRTFAAGDTVFNLQNDPAQFKTWQIGNIFTWSPAAGLDVALDTNYTQTEAKRRILLQGQASANNARFTKNDHNWTTTLRIQRSF